MLSFSKYHSSGNDLILVEDVGRQFPAHEISFIQQLCHRKFGIGADGLVLLQRAEPDFAMRFFNPDGSEAAQCGNALLCLGHFIHALGHLSAHYNIQTKSGRRTVRAQGNQMVASLGVPRLLQWDLPVPLEAQQLRCFVVDTGVPHAVVFENLSHFPLFSKKIRENLGTNVNFAQVVQEKVVQMRTFERGVEGETDACGTGAAAVAFVVAKQRGWQGKFEMVFASGQVLDVYVTDQVEIAGQPKCVFKGFL